MFFCYNRGCGQNFDPERNDENSCRHHPGEPFFHDVYKGWSCCNKKSVDFTEFLSIKGCTLSKHSNIKPLKPEKKSDEKTEQAIELRALIKPVERPPYNTSMIQIKPIVAPALKEAIENFGKKTQKQTQNTSEEDEVRIGTTCKNSGCTYSFTGTSTDEGECQYHPGVPIFHEGMKYWSCCQKRTSDFTVFMGQKGCIYGKHIWFKENKNKTEVNCRYDWHQTATTVVVSVYAKLYDYEQSTVEVNPIRLHVNLLFPNENNGRFDLDLELRGIIDVTKTSAQMFASKVEITMPKAEPGKWQKLDFPHEKLLSAPTAKTTALEDKEKKDSESDDGFNLDDINKIESGAKVFEFSSDD